MVAVRNKSLGASPNLHVNVARSAVARTGKIKNSYQEEALVEAQERREFRKQQTEARKKQEQLVASRRTQQRSRSAANYRQELKSHQAETRRQHQTLLKNQFRQKIRVETNSLETAVNAVNSERSYLGSMLNLSMSTEASSLSVTRDSGMLPSSVEDKNFALEVTKLVKDQITTQFRTAMLAQANTKSDDIVNLLN
jgi:flagellin-like hook-associated protein FlgL